MLPGVFVIIAIILRCHIFAITAIFSLLPPLMLPLMPLFHAFSLDAGAAAITIIAPLFTLLHYAADIDDTLMPLFSPSMPPRRFSRHCHYLLMPLIFCHY